MTMLGKMITYCPGKLAERKKSAELLALAEELGCGETELGDRSGSAPPSTIPTTPVPPTAFEPIRIKSAGIAKPIPSTSSCSVEHATIKEEVPCMSPRYRSSIEKCRTLPTAKLLSLVGALSNKGLLEPYSKLRDHFMAASVALNEQGECAPRFRSLRRTGNKSLSPDDQMYARDLQVIDMHWLYCHGAPITATGVQDIFSSTGFRFDLAWNYACQKVRAQIKADYLGLGTTDENCLFVLQREGTRLLWKRLHETHGGVVKKIKDHLDFSRNRRRESIQVLHAAYRALVASQGHTAAAERLFRLMGHPQNERGQMSRQAKWLRKAGLHTS